MAENLTTDNLKSASSLEELSSAEITSGTRVICAQGNSLKKFPLNSIGMGLIQTGEPTQKKAGSIWIEDTTNKGERQIFKTVDIGGALRQSVGYKLESQPIFFSGSLYVPLADGSCKKIDNDNNVTVFNNIISVQTDGNYIYLIGNSVENTHIISKDGIEIIHGYTAEQVESINSVLALDFVRDIKENFIDEIDKENVCAVMLCQTGNVGAVVYQFYVNDITGKWETKKIGLSTTYDSNNDSYKNYIQLLAGELHIVTPSDIQNIKEEWTGLSILFDNVTDLQNGNVVYIICTDVSFIILAQYVEYKFDRYGTTDFGNIKYLYKINNYEYLALHDNTRKITAVKYTINAQSIIDAVNNNSLYPNDSSKWITPIITTELLDGGQDESAESLAVLYDDDENEIYIESDNNALFVSDSGSTTSTIKVNTLENEKTILTSINVGLGLIYDAKTNTISIDKDALKTLLA